MKLTLPEFKKLISSFSKSSGALSDGAVVFDFKYNNTVQGGLSHVLYLEAASFADAHKMHAYFAAGGSPLFLHNLKLTTADRELPDKIRKSAGGGGVEYGVRGFYENTNTNYPAPQKNLTLTHIRKDLPALHKSIKLVPQELDIAYTPTLIQHEPIEHLSKGNTYRILTGQHFDTNRTEVSYSGDSPMLCMMVKETEPLYDYLDKGFFLMKAPSATRLGKPSYIVTNNYDINTAHIMLMCLLQPALTKLLVKKCFINSHDGDILRLRMEKKLTKKVKEAYAAAHVKMENDYRRSSNLVVVGKLKAGEIQQIKINDITIKQDTATYENVSVEYPNLIDVLYNKLNFNGEFDIYTIVDLVGGELTAKLANGALPADAFTAKKAGEEAPKEYKLPAIKINGIDIEASITKDHQRKVNGTRINKDEIGQVIHRASCYRSAEDYKLFLKATSRMSIKWHDVIANGLPVKIHKNITNDEYNDEIPGLNAPALKFYFDAEKHHIMLEVDKERSLRVSLRSLIAKVNSVNKRTNNQYGRQGYDYKRRDFEWARKETAQALIDTTSETTKDEDGNKVVKAKITLKDIEKVVGLVIENKSKAIERSKEFLNAAIKMTGAVMEKFKGKDAYIVQGKLRKYAVVVENAKVYDYDTQQYRCIVNDYHYKGAGYDDIASRLLALKNDSAVQNKIGTLKGHAQPGAENAHDDYHPERDNGLAALAALPDDAVIEDIAKIKDNLIPA